MAIDPAVRSIRVAKTLTDRFAELVRGPQSFNSSVGATSLPALELRIGEAQQIYPEIWGHLDDARSVLAGRGVDVRAYDQVRASEPRGSIGVSRVDVDSYATSLTSQALGWVDEQIKTATFNVAGLQRAIAAAQALMTAMPEVDWIAVARAEAADLHAAGSLGPINPRSLARWLLIGGGSIAVTYAIYYALNRPPGLTHDVEEDRRAVARQAHVRDLERQLAEHPCDLHVLTELGSEGAAVPAAREGDKRCRAYLDERTHKLDRDPCDATLLDEVIMASHWFGDSMATATAAHYREACAKVGGR